MKTRDRILQASLALFNEQGERNVTTNHIAAHLKISPGNLYYHFRNKTDIIYCLFTEYKAVVDRYLIIPEERPLRLQDKMFYLESVFDGMWHYRFLHRDLEYLLESDERLRRDYREFTITCLSAIEKILRGLESGGILTPHSREEHEGMALNAWLVVTNWMAFLKTAHAGDDADEITREQLQQGIFQVLTLELPYVRPEHQSAVLEMRERYRPKPVLVDSDA